MKQHALRMPDDLAAKIDQRAAMVGMSRNAWLIRAIEWALNQPVKNRHQTGTDLMNNVEIVNVRRVMAALDYLRAARRRLDECQKELDDLLRTEFGAPVTKQERI